MQERMDRQSGIVEPGSTASWLKLVTAVLLVSLLLVCGLVLMLEFGLRLANYPSPASLQAVMPGQDTLLWELAPGRSVQFGQSVYINSFHIRAPELVVPKPVGLRRVLVLGDSSVFGVNVPDDQTFSAVLGSDLGQGIEVINGGVPGYSSLQSLNLLRLRLNELQPDLLLICNIWSDNNFDSFVDAEMLARYSLSGPRALGRLRALLLHSQLYRALEFTVLNHELLGAKPKTVGWGQLGQERLRAQRRVDLSRYAKTLEAIVEEAHLQGGQAAMVMLGNEEDMRSAGRPWPWDPYRLAMRDVARRRGLLLVDVASLLTARGGDPRALLLDAMHPNRQGHQLIGHTIAAALRQSGWLEGKSVETPTLPDLPLPLVDPYVFEQDRPVDQALQGQKLLGAASPDLAGIVRYKGPTPRGIELRLYRADSSAELLDQVWLPRSAPFALQAHDADRVWIEVAIPGDGGTVWTTIHLKEQELKVAVSSTWGLVVDANLQRIDLGPPPGF